MTKARLVMWTVRVKSVNSKHKLNQVMLIRMAQVFCLHNLRANNYKIDKTTAHFGSFIYHGLEVLWQQVCHCNCTRAYSLLLLKDMKWTEWGHCESRLHWLDVAFDLSLSQHPFTIALHYVNSCHFDILSFPSFSVSSQKISQF